MLQGSLDTVSFDEVLGFLASSSKTGVLQVSGDRGTGSVWVTDGQMVAAETTHATSDSLIDEVVFELLRFNSGTFAFDFDEINTNPGPPVAIDNVLAQANKLLVEWRRIEEIIPSLDHRIIPAPRLPADQVTITEDEWSTLLAIGVGSTADDVAGTLQLGQLEGLRRLKGLVERKLVMVTEPNGGHVPEQSSAASVDAATKNGETKSQSSPQDQRTAEAVSASDPHSEVAASADKSSEPLGFDAPTSSSAPAAPAVPPPVAPSARRLSARRAVAEPAVTKSDASSVFESAIPAPPPAPAAQRASVEDSHDDPFAAGEVRPPMPTPPAPPVPSGSAGTDTSMGADVPPPPAPPSPAEIAKFGTSIEDVSSISDSDSDESDGESSLLMRYLQSEG